MEDLGIEIVLSDEEHEQRMLNNYLDTRKKIAKGYKKTLDKHTWHDLLIEGTIGGAVLGLIFGFILGQSASRVPVRSKDKSTFEVKTDKKILTETMLRTLAIAILFMFGGAGIKSIQESKKNGIKADKFADQSLKAAFHKPLESYVVENNDVRAARAAALVLYNMPVMDVMRIRSLLISGLIENGNGKFAVRETEINTVAQILANFINYNPEVGYNVLRVMRGDNPNTYIIPSLQKTR